MIWDRTIRTRTRGRNRDRERSYRKGRLQACVCVTVTVTVTDESQCGDRCNWIMMMSSFWNYAWAWEIYVGRSRLFWTGTLKLKGCHWSLSSQFWIVGIWHIREELMDIFLAFLKSLDESWRWNGNNNNSNKTRICHRWSNQDSKDATTTTIETDCSSSRRGTNETTLYEVGSRCCIPGLNGAGARMSIPPRRMMVMVLVLSRSSKKNFSLRTMAAADLLLLPCSPVDNFNFNRSNASK